MRIKPLSPLWLERAADIVEVEGVKQYSFGEWPHTRLLFEHVVNKHCLLLQCRRDEDLLRQDAQDWEEKGDHYARLAQEARQQADVWRREAQVIEHLLSIVDVEVAPDCSDPVEV